MLRGLLLLALWAVVAGWSAPAWSQPTERLGQRAAVVMGVSAYAGASNGGALRDLPGAARDARRMADVLARLEFLPIMADQRLAAENPGRGDMVNAAVELGYWLQSKPAGVALFYFAGHAAQVGGDVYLIPHGAAGPTEGVSVSALRRAMDADPDDTVILIIDACRTSVLDPRAESAFDFQAARLETDARRQSRFFIGFASSPDFDAFDDGVFSQTLADELGKGGVTLTEAFKRVADELVYRTFQTDRPQRPTYESALTGPPLCLVSCPADIDTFTDCATCPRMRIVPGGVAMIGSPAGERGRSRHEPAPRLVTIAPFAIGVYEVTVPEWKACVLDGDCPSVPNWLFENPSPLLPATHITRENAEAFVGWLRRKTGLSYRLPTPEEWEYAARAGTTTPFWFGATVTPGDASYDTTVRYLGHEPVRPFRNYPETSRAYDNRQHPFGLFNVLGNVWEWSASSNGGAEVRGGGFASTPAELRAASRMRVSGRRADVGLRVVRDLRPGEASLARP